MRSVSDGFALTRPEAESFELAFIKVCRAHDAVEMTGGEYLLKIPQNNQIDATDRIIIGKAFLKQLVDAGL